MNCVAYSLKNEITNSDQGNKEMMVLKYYGNSLKLSQTPDLWALINNINKNAFIYSHIYKYITTITDEFLNTERRHREDLISHAFPPREQFDIKIFVTHIERGEPSICDEVEIFDV